MTDIIRWAIGGTIGAFGLYVSTFAVTRIIWNARNKKNGVDRFVSGVPVVGPFLFILGWLVSPLAWSWWALLVLVVDLDTSLLPVFVLYSLLRSEEPTD